MWERTQGTAGVLYNKHTRETNARVDPGGAGVTNSFLSGWVRELLLVHLYDEPGRV